jgi:hypothetical protein
MTLARLVGFLMMVAFAAGGLAVARMFDFQEGILVVVSFFALGALVGILSYVALAGLAEARSKP